MPDVIPFRGPPAPDCLSRDAYGREMQLYALSYEMDGRRWASEVWAYSWEDAEARVAAMRESLMLDGQTVEVVR